MKTGQIVYSFFIVYNGLLELDSLFISEDLNKTIKYAHATSRNFLMEFGYKADEDKEYSTEDGYAIMVESRYGTPAHEYQKTLWSYSFDGEIILEVSMPKPM